MKTFEIDGYIFEARREQFYCQTSHHFGGRSNCNKWGWNAYYNGAIIPQLSGQSKGAGTTRPNYATFRELVETAEALQVRSKGLFLRDIAGAK